MSTSRSVNKVILIGNLTRNPVLRTIGNGSVVCNFGIATNATWKDGSSNVQERTEFHNLVAWNKLAEICAQILAVGMLIYVEGELRTALESVVAADLVYADWHCRELLGSQANHQKEEGNQSHVYN